MEQLTETLNKVPVEKAQSHRRFYQPELDGLRFYAFLGVFVCHTLPVEDKFYSALGLPVPWLWRALVELGSSGVDVFFVLSAFLITSLLMRERAETGNISLRLFYIRRILRIWPLYFLLVALGILVAQTNQSHFWYYDQTLPWYYITGYVLFVSNWVYAIFGASQSICAPLWTVSIEEQFYLVWPVLAKFLRYRGMLITGMVTFLLATLSQVILVLLGVSSSYVYFGSASRCDSLALGILLALCIDRLPRLSRMQRGLLVGSGLAGCLFSCAWLTNDPDPVRMRMVWGRLIISVASAAIVYGCLFSTSRLLRGDGIVRLGKISYGLYMWHFTGLLLVLSIFHPRHGLALLATKSLGLVATVLIAFASYRWVESPFLRLKNRFATVPSRPV